MAVRPEATPSRRSSSRCRRARVRRSMACVDVLMAAGNLWQTLVRIGAAPQPFRVRIVSPLARPLPLRQRHSGRPGMSPCETSRVPTSSCCPSSGSGRTMHLAGRYPALLAWIRASYLAGSLHLLRVLGLADARRDGPAGRARRDVPLGLPGPFPSPLPENPVPTRAQLVLRRCLRPPGHCGRYDELARSRVAHHRAACQPRRGDAHREGLSAQVARRGSAALHAAGSHAAALGCSRS